MQLSITLPAIYTAQDISLTEAYRALRGCGFAHVGLVLPPLAGRAHFEKHTAAIAAAGMDITSLRVEGNPFASEAERDAIGKAVALAGANNVPAVIVPLGTEANIMHFAYLERNAEYLRKMLDVAEKTGTQLRIENAGSYQIAHYFHHAREIRLLTDKVAHPLLRVHLSTGNLGLSEAQPYPQIRLLSELIAGVELSDNFGAMPFALYPQRQDMQLAPLMGAIDFDQVLQALTEIGFDGVCNLTVNLPIKPYVRFASTGRAKFSPETVNRLYAWVFHVCKTMLSAYDAYDEQ